MHKERMNLPDTGEVTRFYEDTPFEVDGIMYYPPQRNSRFTGEYFRHQPMFVLKSDVGNDSDYFRRIRQSLIQESNRLTSV